MCLNLQCQMTRSALTISFWVIYVWLCRDSTDFFRPYLSARAIYWLCGDFDFHTEQCSTENRPAFRRIQTGLLCRARSNIFIREVITFYEVKKVTLSPNTRLKLNRYRWSCALLMAGSYWALDLQWGVHISMRKCYSLLFFSKVKIVQFYFQENISFFQQSPTQPTRHRWPKQSDVVHVTTDNLYVCSFSSFPVVFLCKQHTSISIK